MAPHNKYKKIIHISIMTALLISIPGFTLLSFLVGNSSKLSFTSLFLATIADLTVKATPIVITYLVTTYIKSQIGYHFLKAYLSVTTLIIAFLYYICVFGTSLFPTSALSGLILVTPYVVLISAPGLIIGLIYVLFLNKKAKIKRE
jgi:hypothetical protein